MLWTTYTTRLPVVCARGACAVLLMLACLVGVVGCAPTARSEAVDGSVSEESDVASDTETDDAELDVEAVVSAEESDLDDLGSEVPPEGFEPEGVALADRLDTYVAENFPLTGVPGVAVAVVDSDGVRYLRTFGDCGSENASFLVGSLSKSFTALAIMQLVEAGRIDLDAPAAWYAPAYAVSLDVTVRDLLNQTSGFGYYESLADARVGGTFGEFSYANANYDLLGRIIEAVSGESYATYLHDQVLAPLGMNDSSADAYGDQEVSMASGYRAWFGVPVADGFVHESSDEAWGTAASGYVAASISDMARYLQMYLNGGQGEAGQRVVSPQGITTMFIDRVPDPEGDTFYGMGWTSFYWDDGEMVLSHDGQVENYVASMCLLPERDVGVVVLGNASDHAGGDNLFFELTSGVVAAAVGVEPDPIDASWVWSGHTRDNTLYACGLLACAAALMLLPRWMRQMRATCSGQMPVRAPGLRHRTRRALLVRAILLNGLIPVGILVLPYTWGMPWPDVLTFAPDTAFVLLACAGMQVVGGVVKLVGAFRMLGGGETARL